MLATRKVKWWLMELDNALRGPFGTGRRLAEFCVPSDPAMRLAPLERPHLSVNADSGPIEWAGQTFLEEVARANMTRVLDPNHGVYNDTLGACFDAGCGPFLYVLVLVLNLPYLPYNRSTKFYSDFRI